MITLGLGCAAWFTANAQDAEGRRGLSEQETKDRQVVIEKYDADGDGVLSKSEQKALSKEDKKALAKSGGVGTAGKAASEPAPKPQPPEKKEAKTQDQDQDKIQRQANAGKVDDGGKTKGSKK